MLRRWPCLPAASSRSPGQGSWGAGGPPQPPHPAPRTPGHLQGLGGGGRPTPRDPSGHRGWAVAPLTPASAPLSLCPLGRPRPLRRATGRGPLGRAVAPSSSKTHPHGGSAAAVPASAGPAGPRTGRGPGQARRPEGQWLHPSRPSARPSRRPPLPRARRLPAAGQGPVWGRGLAARGPAAGVGGEQVASWTSLCPECPAAPGRRLCWERHGRPGLRVGSRAGPAGVLVLRPLPAGRRLCRARAGPGRASLPGACSRGPAQGLLPE